MNLDWPPPAAGTLGGVLLAAALYVVFHYFGHADVLRRRLDPGRGADATAVRAVLLQRVAGFVLLGALPLLYAALALPRDLAFYGLGLGRLDRAGVFVLGVGVVVLPLIARASRSPAFRSHYPQLRVSYSWDAALRRRNAAAWTLYLLGYEFFFRGFLLFALADAFGPWAAVALTTLAYAWAHLPKNAGETLGTLPMGIVFALSALWSGAIWAPWLAHVLIANTSDWLASRPAGPSRS